MINLRYKLNDKEIDTLLKNLVIVMDTREQQGSHVAEYLAKKKVKMKIHKLEHGDYSCFIESNEETKPLGIHRDLYIDTYVERKNSVDEICGNLSKQNQAAFIDELRRAQESKFVLFVEDENFDHNLATGNFRSKYDPKALKGRLESLKVKYNFEIIPMPREMLPHNIYHRFYYQARHALKNCMY